MIVRSDMFIITVYNIIHTSSSTWQEHVNCHDDNKPLENHFHDFSHHTSKPIVDSNELHLYYDRFPFML